MFYPFPSGSTLVIGGGVKNRMEKDEQKKVKVEDAKAYEPKSLKSEEFRQKQIKNFIFRSKDEMDLITDMKDFLPKEEI